MKKIVLVGYMGSGKTTVGRLLAEKTGLPFHDLDHLIENTEQKTISELFLELGEIKFRNLEHDSLADFIVTQQNYILSLGGGTPCYANNHLYLQKEGITSVYLKASIDELSKRLWPEKEHRPLIATMNEEEFTEFIAKHLFERSYFYNQCKHTVAVDGKTPDQIADEIEMLLT